MRKYCSILCLVLALAMCFCGCDFIVYTPDSDTEEATYTSDNGTEVESEIDVEVDAEDTDAFVSGDVIQGDVPEIDDDGIRDKLVSFGFTDEEATGVREILLKCGIDNIDAAEETDPNATIDGLVAFRWEMDDKRTVWLTIENREVYYIGLNGEDVYDRDNGGFLINVDDIHIPESEVSTDVWHTLVSRTEVLLDGYFVNAQWYDAWGVGRSDDQYMVRCEVLAKNKLGIEDWIFATVWYEYDGSEYNVTNVQIDGVMYK